MKLHLNQLLFFALLLFTVACSSDDDDSIDGTYLITSISTVGCDDPDFNESFVLDDDGCYTIDGDEICLTTRNMTFSNGNFSLAYTISSGGISFSLNESGTYTVSGNTVTVCIEGDCDTTPFDISNGTVTFRSLDPDDNCVTTITAKKA